MGFGPDARGRLHPRMPAECPPGRDRAQPHHPRGRERPPGPPDQLRRHRPCSPLEHDRRVDLMDPRVFDGHGTKAAGSSSIPSSPRSRYGWASPPRGSLPATPPTATGSARFSAVTCFRKEASVTARAAHPAPDQADADCWRSMTRPMISRRVASTGSGRRGPVSAPARSDTTMRSYPGPAVRGGQALVPAPSTSPAL